MSRARHGWAAGVLAVVVAVWLALVEVFWLPLRIGGVLFPRLGRRGGRGQPAAAAGWHCALAGRGWPPRSPGWRWLVVVVAGMIRRPEGDLLITGGGATGS